MNFMKVHDSSRLFPTPLARVGRSHLPVSFWLYIHHQTHFLFHLPITMDCHGRVMGEVNGEEITIIIHQKGDDGASTTGRYAGLVITLDSNHLIL